MELGLDLERGCSLAISEMYGDWYRDPWGWPEYTWLQRNPAALPLKEFIARPFGGNLGLHEPAHFHTIEVPKTRLAVRPAVIQDSLTRLLYATATASNLPTLHRNLPDWVFGWRCRQGSGPAQNRIEWANYMELLSHDVGDFAGLQIDISSFFASIKAESICDNVHQRLGNCAAARIIDSVIRQHDSLTTRSGIPQRSFASATLAHLYLQPVDDALQVWKSSGVVITRWMDDITALGAEEQLYRLYLDVQDRIRQLGLEPNSAKTKLTTAQVALDEIKFEGVAGSEIPRHPNHMASGSPIVVDNATALASAQEIVLDDPSPFSRTRLKAILTSLVDKKMFQSTHDWLEVAYKLPHAADALGRFLRASASSSDRSSSTVTWDELSDWFVEFSGRGWASLDWVTAQLALTFPSDHVSSEIASILKEWLQNSSNAQKIAISAQRLAKISPTECRDIIRSRIDTVSDPVLLRILALGLLSARDSRHTVRDVLARDRRNILMLKMLEDQSWRSPRVEGDFEKNRKRRGAVR